jgi:hypothetical protein
MSDESTNDTTTNANASDAIAPRRPLVERLRTTLDAARGNLLVRERVRTMLADPQQLDELVRELGPNHAVIRDLLEVAGLGEPDERAA